MVLNEEVRVRLIDRLIRLLARFNAPLTAFTRAVAGALVGVMLSVVMTQVVFRFVLGSSLAWSEEASKSLMVWSVFLVAPWAYRNAENVSIEILQSSLSPRVRAFVRLVCHLVVLWLLTRLFWESVFFVGRGWTITAASIPIEMAWIYLVTPFSFLAMFLVGVELTLRQTLDLLGFEPTKA